MLANAAIIALTVLFLHATTWEGMVNGWVHKATWKWPIWLKKPLFLCPICMAPWYGFLILTVHGLFTKQWPTVEQWLLSLTTAAGIVVAVLMLSPGPAPDTDNDSHEADINCSEGHCR